MLVKCICSNCSHSYLADDQAGALTCPRCGVNNEGSHHASDVREPAPGMDRAPEEVGIYDAYLGEEAYPVGMGAARFAPQAPPPMYVTGERMVKGTIFGLVATVVLGVILGGAMAAIQVTVPLIAAVVLALAGGATTRYGFGGRTAPRTTGRALFCLLLVMLLGFAGLITGSWAVERFTGTVDRDADGVADVEQTREDLDAGLRGLVRERTRTQDAGSSMLLEQRITAAEHLKQMSDAELEDYLWMQQAHVGEPLLAYAKVRATDAPVVRWPKGKPIHLPSPAPAGVLFGEFVIALILAMRAVAPR